MYLPGKNGAVLAAMTLWLLSYAAIAADVDRIVIAGANLPDVERQREVYDVSVRDPQAIKLLLGRLEALALAPNAQTQPADYALVLHGPELKNFTISNYAQNRDLVDLAAKLDAFQVIEVKACSTKLQSLGLQPHDLPAFIEIVPFGPGEVERMVNEGYLKM